MKIDYRRELNQEQYEVVTKGDGYSLVLAGAGSGKTRTLIYRVAYLIESGVAPGNILLVTFTNKAADLMDGRVARLLGQRLKGLFSGTFHSVGLRIIRDYSETLGLKRDFLILDEEDSRSLIKRCMSGLKVKERHDKFLKPAVVQSIISYSINARTSIESALVARYPYLMEYLSDLKEVDALYQMRRRESGSLDFDDLLFYWLDLLKNHPSARGELAGQFRYILVDEYQDTNRLQFEILRLLSSEHKNLLVVGDDAQSIYSFRAAEIRNILDFPEHFKPTKIFKLTTNYRSTPEILSLANRSIANNSAQFKKVLHAVRPGGPEPKIVEVEDLRAQADFVARQVEALSEEGVEPNETAVLFRAHYQSAELELTLTRRAINYIVRGGVRFFEQAHIKDVLSYLRILENPSDEVSWIRALSLQRGIGATYADRIFQAFLKENKPLPVIFEDKFADALPGRLQASFDNFAQIMSEIINMASKAHPEEIIRAIIETGYEEYLHLAFENAEERYDDLMELINFAHSYDEPVAFLADITLREDFQKEISQGEKRQDHALILSTIHQAKGLEWKAVLLIGLCEGQFPHDKSRARRDELEEERRLFYVACTRAMDWLYLVYPRERYDYRYGTVSTGPSIFLDEVK